ncbi:MAG: guanylate kinase [bacterium]|jgi:guanylate kinase
MQTQNPLLFVLSAPSGTGKTTIAEKTLESVSCLETSISFTTRESREGEKDGEDYFFISKEEFERKIADNDFVEWATVYGNFYGTSKSYIQERTNAGKHVLLVIDTQGALNLQKQNIPNAVYIFMRPPSLQILRERLEKRGTETQSNLDKRLGSAEYEMSFQNHYDYVIINDKVGSCVQELIQIIIQESLIGKTVKGKVVQQLTEKVMTRLEENLSEAIQGNIEQAIAKVLPKLIHKEIEQLH